MEQNEKSGLLGKAAHAGEQLAEVGDERMSPLLLLKERLRARNRRESCYHSTLGPQWDIERALEASASALFHV